MSIGLIKVGGYARGSGYAHDNNFLEIPIWSRGNENIIACKSLSPFTLGPIQYKNYYAKNLENFWQFLKVYPKVVKQSSKDWSWPSEIHAVASGNYGGSLNGEGKVLQNQIIINNLVWTILPAYFNWQQAGFNNSNPVRRPNSSVKVGGLPLCHLFEGEVLDYISARKKIYLPFYQFLVRQKPAYQQLLNLVRSGKNIMLVEPDGPNVRTYPEGRVMNFELLEQLINDPSQIYGHGYALALTLLEDLRR